MIASEIAKESIKRHEGLRLKLYLDTVGKSTIGYGHNLDDRGISAEIAEDILAEDMDAAEVDARVVYGEGFDALSVNRQAVFIELSFQLGYNRLLGFVNALAASRAGNHAKCADELANSKWAQQVPKRAQEMIGVYRLG